MKIATWNINSIRQRIDNLTSWLARSGADIVCLQEIKCQDEQFPRAEIEALGYNVAVHGQKSFNGVAILSKPRIDEVIRGLPGDPSDEQARYIEAVISTEGGVLRIASIYLPNGNPVESDKYPYKLDWMDRLKAHAADLLAQEEALVLAGDYNVIPEARDAKFPELWVNDALFLPRSRAKFREIVHLGLTEAIRATSDDEGLYSFWDYQAGAWQKNNGIRIDHLLLSPQAADRLRGAGIDKEERSREKPSDHVPVWVELDLRAPGG
jgi:exodeoxyribonuclease-3